MLPVPLTASIGIANFPSDASTFEAKRLGRDRAVDS
jgi:hypothetical protein